MPPRVHTSDKLESELVQHLNSGDTRAHVPNAHSGSSKCRDAISAKHEVGIEEVELKITRKEKTVKLTRGN